MNKYGRLLPDEGDNLRETGPAVSDKAHLEADKDLFCDDLPGDESYQDTAKSGDQTNITVHTISCYKSGEILATPPDLDLNPGSHLPEEGNDHRISANFVARICGRDFQTVIDSARTGSYFLKLEYHLTGSHLPRFTSRVLVVEDQCEDISLSGGLEVALRLLKLAKALDADKFQASRRRHFTSPKRKRLLDRLRTENQRYGRTLGPGSHRPSLFTPHMEQPTIFPQPPSLSLLRSLPSLCDINDQNLVSTDSSEYSMKTPPLTMATSETNWPDGLSETTGILNRSPENHLKVGIPKSGWPDEWTLCRAKGQQSPRAEFEQQKRRARAMHAHNGDTSGMVSLMSLATTSPFTDSSNLFYKATRN